MKPQLIYLMLLFGILLSPRLQAQNDIFFAYDFTIDVLPPDWDVTDAAGNMTRWQWTFDGKATAGQYWNNRPAIGSASGGGAYMFDSDGQHPPATFFPDNSILTSEKIDCSSHDEVWLQFNQYYRNASSVTKVGVSNDDGASWTDLVINSEIGFGVETPNDALVKLNLTAYAANSPDVRVRFIFEGANYFWIIDDIKLIDPDDIHLGFPRTFPPELGDSLTAWNIPYHIDSLGGAYPPYELVIKWVDGLTDLQKQEVRDELNVIQYDTCNCSELELFTFANTISLPDTLNIIINGDFSEEGSSGFTSELSLECGCGNASYCIGTMYSDKCSSFTTNFGEYANPGTGQFMIIEGSTSSSSDVWCQSLSLETNKDYIFTFRARAGTTTYPNLQLHINGPPVSLLDQTVNSFGKWTTYSFSFRYTGVSGSANVCLRQENTGAINYALDDLFMANLDAAGLVFQDSIEEKKEKADAMPGEIQESDYNYYTFDIEELQDTTLVINDTFPVFDMVEVGQEDDLLIAILDTGLDYNYNRQTPIGNFDIRPYLWRDPDLTTCYPEDYRGWNFVNRYDPSKRDRPFDDHGHGSHVAGIVVQEWERLRFQTNSQIDGCCRLKILPVKTHDFHGLGKLFDVSCGIIYATEMGADVINASWGFTAVQDPDEGILHFVIDNAMAGSRSVMIVTSSGNTSVDIDSPVGAPATPNYPSNYNLDNILTVAAMDSMENRWVHSNFSTTKAHYAAPGDSIYSIIPPGTYATLPALVWAPKSGTSMAAPVVTAYTGALKCMNNINDVNGLKITLNNLAVPINPSWLNWTITGKKMDLSNFLGGLDFTNCIVGTETPLSPNAEWQIYPNPAADNLWLSITNNQVPIRSITLTNALGQMVWQEAPAYNQGELELKISLQDLPSGLYYLSIYTERGVQGFPVVKQK